MDINYTRLYILLCLNVLLFVKAQVTIDPDPEGGVQLQVTPLTPNISVTTVQCYSQSPTFTVQYVTTKEPHFVYDIDIYDSGLPIDSPVNGTVCENDKRKFRVQLANLHFIADPELVGGTFRLKVILGSSGGNGNSTTSTRTYTFPAPFNITGSHVAAIRYFNFTWTCHVTSDYPVIEWFRLNTTICQLGILPNKTCFTSHHNDSYICMCQQSAFTYTLTLTGRSLTEELQGTIWRCRDVKAEVNGSKFMELDIVYPPTVSLNLQNTTENTVNHSVSVSIRCTTVGKPNNATIVALQQRIGSTFIRNITSFTEFTPGTITLTIPTVSYQDMGTYTCLASNGIPDRNNQKIQSDRAYLNVNSSAKFKMMQYTVRCDIDTPAVVRIPFYRNPPASEGDVVWINNTGTPEEIISSSAEVSLSLNTSDVQQIIHGVDVKLIGQSAIMTITSFKSFYEGNYTLKITSPIESGEVTIVILGSGPPDTPSHFHLLTRKVTSIFLSWTKGSDGGHPQTFVILYKEKTSEVYTRKQLNDTSMDNNITDEVKNLKPDTSYEFILFSFNEKGNSTGHQTLENRTLKAPVVSAPSSLNSGLVGGAAGGGVAVLAVIIVIIVVVRRHQEGKGNEYNSRETLAGPPKRNDDNEDSLKDNPLYGGNPCGANAVQGTSKSPDNPSLYAEVAKPKKKSPAKVIEDPPPIYAEVDKSSKKNAKGKQKKQNAKDTAGGEQNQNMDGFKQTGSTEQKAKENELRGYKNKDGLFYMDVKFDQPPTRSRPTIRKEEPTGYAMIQFEEPNAKPTSNNVRGAEGGQ